MTRATAAVLVAMWLAVAAVGLAHNEAIGVVVLIVAVTAAYVISHKP